MYGEGLGILLFGSGVADAARTRDLLNHNQVLYQLSYSHHMQGFHTRATDENYTRLSGRRAGVCRNGRASRASGGNQKNCESG